MVRVIEGRIIEISSDGKQKLLRVSERFEFIEAVRFTKTAKERGLIEDLRYLITLAVLNGAVT